MLNLETLVPHWQQLREESRNARARAWAPYSKFYVGAALLTEDGIIVSGCNVENASYGLTICAERVAACSAVALGHRRFVALSVSLLGMPSPCGACRQFLTEFSPDMWMLLDDVTLGDAAPEVVRLSDLLPRAFRLEH